MAFILVLILSIVWIFVAGFILPNWHLKLITKRFIVPYFENKKVSFSYIRPVPFSIPRDKGDFNNEIIINPFYDTRFNKKKYYFVFYLTNTGDEKRITAKVSYNFYGFPKGVEFYPEIP
ncbi:hypothetical protein F0919_03910 [Taibaiella lutea]|uniref:Uncharacterized protein n=1 Tax=Taibaiella lutea TaxID=2608001 RepID=A0A5M6CUZ0_9BACT|nr:hypothetical protein [Taibaiella lutea]KAA5536825.1 hypothetical protein F0919_03910 [Taibaiella lutea]